jgi:Ca-activated chloride channel family protein
MILRFTFLLLLASSLVLTSSDAREQDPQDPAVQGETISVETNLVVVNVTVTDANDRYVSGLKAEDFKLFEDNSQQKISSFGLEETPFAATIMLDISGSMEHKITLTRASCTYFVDRIREGDTFSIYSFGGSKVTMYQDFTEIRDIPDKIWDLRAQGHTPLYDAIVTGSDALLKRPEKRRAILIVSDGADTNSRASVDQALRKAVAAQVAIYGVDMSDSSVYGASALKTGTEVLKMLANKTGGRFFRVPGGSQLRDAFVQTVEELRNQYTLTYDSSNERFDGRWRSIEVRVARPQLNIRARQGYYARKK